MAGQAPPPSYDEVVKSNPPPDGFPQGPPVTSATAPYPPAGYSPGMPPAQPSYPPPPAQWAQGTQPPTEGGYPQYTYSAVTAVPIAPGGGHHYLFPDNQGGPAYQYPNVTVSAGNFQMAEPAPFNQTQNAKKKFCFIIAMFFFIFVVIIVVINVTAIGS